MLKTLLPSRVRVAGVVLLSAIPLAFAAPASSHAPAAHAAASCPLSRKDWTGFGYSYMQRLWVYGTNCSTGRYVAKKHGSVKGWRCGKQILDKSPVQYNAKETCTSGRKKVVWQYTENT